MKKPIIDMGCYIHSDIEKELRNQFNQESNVICELYYRLLPNPNIKYLQKISIDLTPNQDEHTYISPGPPLKYPTVCCIVKVYDFEAFFQKNAQERKEAILDAIQQNIREATVQFGWDVVPFEEAYQKVQEVNFVNKFIVWGDKFFSTKDRRYQAAVELDIDITSATITVLFFDSAKQLIKTVEVTKVRPHAMFISQLLGKGKWLNSKEFVLSNKEKEIHFTASLEEGTVSLSITPIIKTEQQLLNDLKILSPDISQEEAIKLINENMRLM